MLTSEFTELMGSAAGSKPMQAVTIIFGTFILEDAATLLAAMQAATGAVPLKLALGAFYAGIVLGDLGLYGLGALSARHPWARRLIPPRRQDIGHVWVRRRVIPLVLISRFVPGLRLPTYTTLGFLRAPILPFALAAIAATLVWTSGLFFISLRLGGLMERYLGIWRWAGLAIFCLILILVGRVATHLYNRRTR
jgi:membrane protein DedA with SNARE-associated domain